MNPALERQGLAGALRAAVGAEFAGSFERVEWRVDQALELSGREVAAGIAAEVAFYAVMEAVRNAANHGRGDEPGRPTPGT